MAQEMGFALLGLLLMGLIAGEIFARVLPRWGYPRGAVVLRSLMLLAVGVYGGLLLAVSLTSEPKVLAHGEAKRFCGFYFDCHMAVQVDQVQRAERLGEARSSGAFYVVGLRVSSDAREATLQLARPEIVVVDADGRVYERSADGEAALASVSGDPGPLVRPVAAGASFLRPIVFDLPAEVREPRLLVRDFSGVDRVLEAILIGDEDSFLHKPVYLEL